MEEIRDRLRELRAKLKLQQGEFAAKMGMPQSTWSNIEHGVNPCSERYVNLICLTYRVRKEWLLEGRGSMFKPELPDSPQEPIFDNEGKPLLPELAELIAAYRELVPLNQKAVSDFVETTLRSQRNTMKAVKS
jgi:transcriptional regulator with XRE-family HTH domain